MPTSLIVRNVDEQVVQSLRESAARHGRSAEAEHRAILKSALLEPRKKGYFEVLASMPNVGEDLDFDPGRD